MRQISLTRYLCASFLALRMSWGVTLGGVVWGSVTGVPMSKNNCPKPPGEYDKNIRAGLSPTFWNR